MQKRNTDTRYQKMTMDEIFSETAIIEQLYKGFLHIAGYPPDVKYDVDARAVVEMLVRIDKRTAYYSYFHSGNKIHELKRAGSLIYWLIKLKPFRITDERIIKGGIDLIDEAFHLNESFAIFLTYSALRNFGKLKTIPQKDSDIQKNLLYAFKYREMPQDAIMTLTYSLMTVSDI